MPKFLSHLKEKDVSFYKQHWFAAPERRRGRLLDLPTGTGKDTRGLIELGYDVVPADLFPEFFAKDIPAECVKADMERPLPFPDESFDYVLNSEGIEHLADQFTFLRECARILKPGGVLAVTTPNLLCLRARAAFMFAGNRAFKSFVDEVTTVWGFDGDRIYHGHAFLINYFQLRYMLWHSGLRITEVVGTHYSGTSLVMSPMIPLVALFTRGAMRKVKRHNPNSRIYDEIARDVLSPAMYYSKNLFVIAEKLPAEQRTKPVVVRNHAARLVAQARG